jgi:hypothetical protein
VLQETGVLKCKIFDDSIQTLHCELQNSDHQFMFVGLTSTNYSFAAHRCQHCNECFHCENCLLFSQTLFMYEL